MRRVDHLHHRGRHPPKHRDPLPLDELEGALGVEVMHHHELSAGGRVGHHDGETAGHVEERHREKVGVLDVRAGRSPGLVSALAGRIGAGAESHGRAHAEEVEVHQVGAEVAVGADRSLGSPRRARGVEDRRVVLGVEGGGRRLGVVGGIAQPLREVVDRDRRRGWCRPSPSARRPMLVGDQKGAEVGKRAEHRGEPIRALGVGDHHDAFGIRQGKGQLLCAPPRIERDGDGAGEEGPPKRDDPLGQVAHGDRHAVALGDPVLRAQAMGEGGGEPVVVVEGDVLVLVDEEVGRTVPAGELEDVGRARGGVLPHPGSDAADLDLFHLEDLARGRQLLDGRLPRPRRRRRAGGLRYRPARLPGRRVIRRAAVHGAPCAALRRKMVDR